MSDCETFQMAALAELDGEPSPVEPAALEAHVAVCAACQSELAGLRSLDAAFAGRSRRAPERAPDLWEQVAAHLEPAPPPPAPSPLQIALVAAGVALLVAYRIAEVAPRLEPSLVFKLCALLAVVAAFAVLGVQPLRIELSTSAAD